MDYKKVVLFTSLVLSLTTLSYAQEKEQVEEHRKKLSPEMYLDSIKGTFVDHVASKAIQVKWLNEFNSQDIYNTLEEEIVNYNFDQEEESSEELTTELLKERLQLLNEKTPFNVEYNPTLEKVIKSFLKNRKRSFERLIGLSSYYFPMFEEKLAGYDVPLEVKYLTIVESALNPLAKSRVGATGLWQFMYATGKQYNLEVNSFVDERQDPIKASEAAAKFLADLYGMFGDWDLVLASYNAGPGNVAKAIRRSNGLTNYWNIRPNLPKETQNYLPAFYATMYLFEYAKEHGIVADPAPFKMIETDTVAMKRMVSFEQLSDLLDISKEEIKFLNPTYKIDKLPYVTGEQHFLRLPLEKLGLLVSNEEKIYAYLDFLEEGQEKPNHESSQSTLAVMTNETKPKYHVVKKGESLGVIANKYGLSLQQFKNMNNLKSNLIQPGKKLIVGKLTVAQASGGKYYTVKKGDSLYSISKKVPGATIAKLKNLNNISEKSMLKPGMRLILN